MLHLVNTLTVYNQQIYNGAKRDWQATHTRAAGAWRTMC